MCGLTCYFTVAGSLDRLPHAQLGLLDKRSQSIVHMHKSFGAGMDEEAVHASFCRMEFHHRRFEFAVAQHWDDVEAFFDGFIDERLFFLARPM
jgi:hypothetical protein